MPSYTQASCTCPVHCPSEGLEERQQAALDRKPALTDDKDIQTYIDEARKRFNPLARQFWEEHEAEVEAVEHLLPEGSELSPHPGCRIGTPATDDECRFAWLMFDHANIDLTGDISGQLATTLENLALSFLQSAVWLRNPPADEVEEAGAINRLDVPAAVAELIQELPIDLQARGTGTPGEFALQVSQTIHITDSTGDVGGDLASALDYLADETDQAATAIRQRLTLPASPLRGPHTRPGEVAATPAGLDVG